MIRGPMAPGDVPRPKPTFLFAVLALLILTALCSAAGGWSYFYGPCGTVPVSEAVKHLRQLAARWDDAEQLANVTARIALAGPLSDLQSIEREVENLTVPKCLE